MKLIRSAQAHCGGLSLNLRQSLMHRCKHCWYGMFLLCFLMAPCFLPLCSVCTIPFFFPCDYSPIQGPRLKQLPGQAQSSIGDINQGRAVTIRTGMAWEPLDRTHPVNGIQTHNFVFPKPWASQTNNSGRSGPLASHCDLWEVPEGQLMHHLLFQLPELGTE